jgi:hypothetical protein
MRRAFRCGSFSAGIAIEDLDQVGPDQAIGEKARCQQRVVGHDATMIALRRRPSVTCG